MSGFTSFLSKFGQIALRGVQIASGIIPTIGAVAPQSAQGVIGTVAMDLPAIAQVVLDVEAMGQVLGTPGSDKARVAGPLIGQVVLQSTLLAGKKIANPDLFNKGCVELGGAIADILNSIHPDGLAVENKAA